MIREELFISKQKNDRFGITCYKSTLYSHQTVLLTVFSPHRIMALNFVTLEIPISTIQIFQSATSYLDITAIFS